MPVKGKDYDFEGWATAYGIRCADGRTLMPGAFNDSTKRVPLVYQHNHTDIDAILGHADLEPRDEGVYVYGKFSDTPNGRNARTLVRDGSIRSLSINANHLVQEGSNVVHGVIREVSLVLAGANPKATIEFPQLAHGYVLDLEDADEVIIHNVRLDGGDLEQSDEEENVTNLYNPNWLDEDDVDAERAINETSHADYDDETVGERFDRVMASLAPDDRGAIEAVIGAVAEASTEVEDEEVAHMYNVFDGPDDVLSHSELLNGMISEARSTYNGSLKDAALAHGIENIELLFPDPYNVDRTPFMIDRDQEWVSTVLNGAGKVPAYRIRSLMANITEDEARALGYIRGNRKKDEVFKLLRRVTAAQTIYKRQALDRDDILEVTDFDLANWIQSEMRGKLNEELARAILLGDGRDENSEDKIREDSVRPIWKDNDLFTIKATIAVASSDAINTQRKAIISSALNARVRYRGSGNPALFIDSATLAQMLQIEDLNGRRIYESEQALATAMRVSKIVEVPLMENMFDGDDTSTRKMLCAIIVNMSDYRIGAGRGGQVTTFNDFDIDFNKYKYLIETRMCGTLVRPYSAIALMFPAGFTPAWYVEGGTMTYTADFEAALGDVAEPTISYAEAKPVDGDNPSRNGWYEKDGDVYTLSSDGTCLEDKVYYVRRVTRNVTGFSVT